MSFVNGHQITVRTFGWIQDPGKFENLKRVVGVFYYGSAIHQELINNIIPNIVEERDGRSKFIRDLSVQPLQLKYDELVGTSFYPRNTARCNGIIQAVLPGQRRPFQSDWPANNFLRWAHALGFISYDYVTDSFIITEEGKYYIESTDGSANEEETLTKALLSYPPVMRILNLLSDGSHLTKYELGQQLGFIGEDGFTTLPQNILLEELASIDNADEKNKIKTDWDGSSDKYARMICSWLKALGWVKQEEKSFNICGKTEKIGQAYKITNKGLTVRRRGLGTNIASRIVKNVYWELFAPKCSDRVYIRTRRSYILKILNQSNRLINVTAIKNNLFDRYKLTVSEETIKDDIVGFVNIGLNIEISDRGFIFKDTIKDFIIPELTIDEVTTSDIFNYKEDCRTRLTHIPHSYLSLIDLAFDSQQNRLFEMQTIQLFVDECGFSGRHLGGGRKPDGVIYRTEEQHGIIIDTKAYSGGYSLPINQADEMTRYVRENIGRSTEINPNAWWNNFPESIKYFNFAFISSLFKGNFVHQLNRIALDTNVNGAALNVINMLLLAEKIKSNSISYDEVYEKFASNNEIICS
jgi:hypothetical protein